MNVHITSAIARRPLALGEAQAVHAASARAMLQNRTSEPALLYCNPRGLSRMYARAKRKNSASRVPSGALRRRAKERRRKFESS